MILKTLATNNSDAWAAGYKWGKLYDCLSTGETFQSVLQCVRIQMESCTLTGWWRETKKAWVHRTKAQGGESCTERELQRFAEGPLEYSAECWWTQALTETNRGQRKSHLKGLRGTEPNTHTGPGITNTCSHQADGKIS